MFGYSIMVSPQNTAVANPRTTTPLKPPSTIVKPGSEGRTSLMVNRRPHNQSPVVDVSDRYSNRAYSRQPSPDRAFQSRMMGGRGSPYSRADRGPNTAAERPRARVVSATTSLRPRPPASAQLRRRTLVDQCQKPRPKTAGNNRDQGNIPVKESPSIEDRLLIAVKEVLSQVVIEKGKIDEKGIESVVRAMRTCLREQDKKIYDDSCEINVRSKRSKTKVKVETPMNRTLVKPRLTGGIVRQNTESGLKKEPYRKMYGPSEITSVAKRSNNKTDDIDYVELPDSDYSNFSSIVRGEEELLKSNNHRKSERSSVKNMTNEVLIPEESIIQNTGEQNIDVSSCGEGVGDYEAKDQECFSFWNSSEDEKLKYFIESMIYKMKDELNCKKHGQENGTLTDTVCKTFCLCKVCISRKNTSNSNVHCIGSYHSNKTNVNENPKKSLSHVLSTSSCKVSLTGAENPETEHAVGKFGNNRSHLGSSIGNPKVQRMVSKDSKPGSVFKVLQRNTNFQPDSKINIVPDELDGSRRPQSPERPDIKASFTVIEDSEEGEDHYLKRRKTKNIGNRKFFLKTKV